MNKPTPQDSWSPDSRITLRVPPPEPPTFETRLATMLRTYANRLEELSESERHILFWVLKAMPLEENR